MEIEYSKMKKEKSVKLSLGEGDVIIMKINNFATRTGEQLPDIERRTTPQSINKQIEALEGQIERIETDKKKQIDGVKERVGSLKALLSDAEKLKKKQ